ncbi:hypothetical protein, conserved [Trypanosoma brucei gambiense DAL972]|uniref:RING-type domain-containing protein n=1 Tax=Trypanosoma brucei gambiense (strain MHOM/CI/86/DAL972) TaxID=679716 RepID=D0A294_TRYB9|nr:hypothetical protein, conserved [Trypanosoma brucei gambiense DAL972]CBH15388.1 hypothetical protein, conserved [Trypanosoma brucei gambiense DAL972]|eukprot:XP_011777652.1 hypothetical protein, conserved [Trypanosoma brucei gambiense DAL972]
MTTELNSFRVRKSEGAEGEEEDPALTELVFKKLRQTFLCPICHRPLQENPTALDVCGHVFCHSCIVNAIEKSSPSVKDPWEEDERQLTENSHGDQWSSPQKRNSRGRGNINDVRTSPVAKSGRGRSTKRLRLGQSCPICSVPAQISDLISVSLVSNLVSDIMKHPLLSAALVSPKGNDDNDLVKAGHIEEEEALAPSAEVSQVLSTLSGVSLTGNAGVQTVTLQSNNAPPVAEEATGEPEKKSEHGIHRQAIGSLPYSPSATPMGTSPLSVTSHVSVNTTNPHSTVTLSDHNFPVSVRSRSGSPEVVGGVHQTMPEPHGRSKTRGVGCSSPSEVCRPLTSNGDAENSDVLRNFEELSSSCSESGSSQDLQRHSEPCHRTNAVGSGTAGGGALTPVATAVSTSVQSSASTRHFSQKPQEDVGVIDNVGGDALTPVATAVSTSVQSSASTRHFSQKPQEDVGVIDNVGGDALTPVATAVSTSVQSSASTRHFSQKPQEDVGVIDNVGGDALTPVATAVSTSVQSSASTRHFSQKPQEDVGVIDNVGGDALTPVATAVSTSVQSNTLPKDAPTVREVGEGDGKDSSSDSSLSSGDSSLSSSSSSSFFGESFNFRVHAQRSEIPTESALIFETKGTANTHENQVHNGGVAMTQNLSSCDPDICSGRELLNHGKNIAGGSGARERSTSTISTSQLSEHKDDVFRLPHTFSVDASVENSTKTGEVLVSAAQMFGARVLDERMGSVDSRLRIYDPKPQKVIRHVFRLPSCQGSGAPAETQLCWKERHYAAASITCSYCLIMPTEGRLASISDDGSCISDCGGVPSARDSNLTSMTPTTACALVSGALVTDFRWIVESVAARCLLPALQYSKRPSWSRHESVSTCGGSGASVDNQTPGRWAAEGHAFMLLPDSVLKLLLQQQTSGSISMRGSSRELSATVTGGYDFCSWRRLILLSGGVLLRFPEECVRQLLLDAMSMSYNDVMIGRNGCDHDERMTAVQNAMHMANGAGRSVFNVECCPERCTASTFLIRNVIILRDSVSTGKDAPSSGSQLLFKRRLERILQSFSVLLSLVQSREVTPVRDVSPSQVFVGSKPFVTFGDVTERYSAPHVMLRSTKWLLRTFSGRLQDSSCESCVGSDQ